MSQAHPKLKTLFIAAALLTLGAMEANAKGMNITQPQNVTVGAYYGACVKSGGTPGKFSDKNGTSVSCTGASSGSSTCSTTPGGKKVETCVSTPARVPPKKWHTAGGNVGGGNGGVVGGTDDENGNTGGNVNPGGGRPDSAGGAGVGAGSVTGDTSNGRIN